MKRLSFIFIISGLFTLLSLNSCKKYVDINISPNSPLNVSPDVVLTAAEVNLGYAVGGADVALITGIFDKEVVGSDRQFFAYQSYVFTADNFSNIWGTMYESVMNNLYQLIQISKQNNYKYYDGIAKTLMAYSIGMVTDLWGDVPYSQAFQGDANFKPAYDKQQDIYTAIFQLLNDAAADFQTPSAQAGRLPGKDDIIYNGSASKWLKFVNSLRLRFLIHTVKVDNQAVQKILNNINATGGLFASSNDNAKVSFLNDESRANPLYQFEEQRGGYANYHSYFSDQLIALQDPRVNAYLDTANYATGTAGLGPLVASINSPVTLMSYAELQFILAEAYTRLGDYVNGLASYQNAVSASILNAGGSSSDVTNYFVNNAGDQRVDYVASTNKLLTVMTQKYFALFLQYESFTDWRRTGFPALTPNTGTQIPRRYLYPQTEISYNSANVPQGTTLFTKVWWDQ
ncbi:SusD-like starch-binding protein associating with outer membrane [Thermoflavifilum aggregans]|uniref:SusD-like starch-binding protein associating with outer membrane n=1 Tax=Thermoflavifilum aggregans TaxID=454188 RepID=A0A2M9CWU0_9BACT|nr:SusD/RagB family nutrient-binding outer membrane lipoprotein [Thermoflavifilum aggregans]PJJ76384.1 SusD-like starch-binding protein associating with outer membrane [Thermoflavifilum aggregans]